MPETVPNPMLPPLRAVSSRQNALVKELRRAFSQGTPGPGTSEIPFLSPGGRPRRLASVNQAGGLPRRCAPPWDNSSRLAMASLIRDSSAFNSSRILLTSIPGFPSKNGTKLPRYTRIPYDLALSIYLDSG